MINVAKKQIVEKILKDCVGSEALFFVNFKGVSVLLERTLRSDLKKNNAFMRVAKVRLVKIALKEFGMPEDSWSSLDEVVDEQLAVVFAKSNSHVVAKSLLGFQRKILDTDKFVVGGIYKLALCSVSTVRAWSKLPVDKNLIIQRLAFSLSYPLSSLARVLSEVSNKI